MMAADLMRNIIEATNLHTEVAQKPLDYEQLPHFLGILLAMMTLASALLQEVLSSIHTRRAPCVIFYKEVKRPAVVEAYF